jgi:ACR3 family arsenite efflux pump ArsB
LAPLFIISLCIGSGLISLCIGSGLVIGYFSPDDMTHIISSVSTAALSVSAALVVMFILFLRPTLRSLGFITYALSSNKRAPKNEDQRIKKTLSPTTWMPRLITIRAIFMNVLNA